MLIDIKNLYKIYNEGQESEVRALDGVSLQIDRGGICGHHRPVRLRQVHPHEHSGLSGYSHLRGLPPGRYPTSPSLPTSSWPTSAISRSASSSRAITSSPALSARENVELPLIYQGVGMGQRAQRAMESLERVGMADRADHKPSEMSGGQQQRVAPSPGPSPPTPPSSWPTSPPAPWTPRQGGRCWRSSTAFTRTAPPSSLITHDNGIAATRPNASSASPTDTSSPTVPERR